MAVEALGQRLPPRQEHPVLLPRGGAIPAPPEEAAPPEQVAAAANARRVAAAARGGSEADSPAKKGAGTAAAAATVVGRVVGRAAGRSYRCREKTSYCSGQSSLNENADWSDCEGTSTVVVLMLLVIVVVCRNRYVMCRSTIVEEKSICYEFFFGRSPRRSTRRAYSFTYLGKYLLRKSLRYCGSFAVAKRIDSTAKREILCGNYLFQHNGGGQFLPLRKLLLTKVN